LATGPCPRVLSDPGSVQGPQSYWHLLYERRPVAVHDLLLGPPAPQAWGRGSPYGRQGRRKRSSRPSGSCRRRDLWRRLARGWSGKTGSRDVCQGSAGIRRQFLSLNHKKQCNGMCRNDSRW